MLLLHCGQNFIKRFEKLLNKITVIVRNPGVLKALLTWPKFSFASYMINYRLKNSNVEPKTIVDVGANVGQFAVAASKFFNQSMIISIEPDPMVSKELKKNLRGHLNFEVITCAVGNTIGKVKFYKNQDSQVSSILEIGGMRKSLFPESRVTDEVDIPINTLDALFDNRNIESPILVKLDVQGAELMVIDGARDFLNKVKWLVIEIAFVDLYKGEPSFEKICKMLDLHGFEFIKPLNFHASPSGLEIIEMDAFFQRRGS